MEAGLLLNRLRLHFSEDANAAKAKARLTDPNSIVTRFYRTKSTERAAALEKAIATFVVPDSWTKAGKGAIQAVESTLVIRQSVKVHGEIAKFLNRLNATESAQ